MEYKIIALQDQFKFDLTPLTLKNIPSTHEFIYILDYDLTAFPNKKLDVLINELLAVGHIISACFCKASENLTPSSLNDPQYYIALYSTILSMDFMEEAASLSSDYIFAVDKARLTSGRSIIFDRNARTVSFSAKNKPLQDAAPLPESNEEWTAEDLELPVTPDMVEQFVVESDELLEQIEHYLCNIDDNPDRLRENLADAFRLIHSFKGHSGLLGLKDFERLSHKMENFLDVFKDAPETCNQSCRNLLLSCIDLLHKGLTELAEDGDITLPESHRLIKQLEQIQPGSISENKRQTSIQKQIARKKALKKRSVQRHHLRVDLEKLDLMVNLVGELVIAETMVTRSSNQEKKKRDNFERRVHNLRRIISELQNVVMSVRMVPLTRTFRRLMRLVHDLSLKSGKIVRLKITGEDTEMDKTVIEQISDPLIHIIRNCIDHGIEPPEERRTAGKPEEGTIWIEARHEGGEVLIRVSDDGRGLDRDKIFSRASKIGLISNILDSLNDDDLYQLVFEPGFSTADTLSSISGRGIGMEVVRRNVEKLKGRVSIKSTPGKGASLLLSIPLTLAIMDGMLIRIGDIFYTIPLLSIRESFRPSLDQITKTISGHEVVKIRNSLLPVVRLHKLYNIVPEYESLDQGILINVTAGVKNLCFFVDEIIGHHQTVIKAMPEYIGTAAGISGCTILEDGEVGLILDVASIVKMVESEILRRVN